MFHDPCYSVVMRSMFFATVEEKNSFEVIKTANANSAMQQNKIARIKINEALNSASALCNMTQLTVKGCHFLSFLSFFLFSFFFV